MKTNKKSCIECRHFDICPVGETKCHCNKHNIDINIIKETDEDIILDKEACNDFDEARYVVTEVGVLSLALSDLGIVDSIEDKRINTAWTIFFENAKKYGFYVEDNEEREYPKTDKSVDDFFKSVIRIVFKIYDEDTLDAAWILFKKGMIKAKYF